MSATQMSMMAPLATILPDPPAGEVLTAAQWTTLFAIAEAVIPSIRQTAPSASTNQLSMSQSEMETAVAELREGVDSPPKAEVMLSFLGEGATTYEAFRRDLHRTLLLSVPEDGRKKLAFLLSSMNTRIGSLVFTGSTVPFHDFSLADRTAIMKAWSRSYLLPLRATEVAFSRLIKSTWARTSPTLGLALGCPRNPAHGTPGKGFPFDFVSFPAGTGAETLETDVIIVGSGCGAGVAAKNLAEDGHRVMVVDKGHYYPAEYLPMTELHGPQLLFENGGILPSDDTSVSLAAGSTWGGGGTINWSASLQTQGFVRKEWADQGLTFFTSAEYQACLDRVCHRMGVSTEAIQHNHGNQVLLEGARRLGYSAKAVPQNTGGKQHFCGYCSLGCGSAEKQGPVVSWLPDAARAGARFMEGYKAEQVIFEDGPGGPVAVGVKGMWKSRDGRTTRDVVVQAKKVVVSAGSLHSPLLLQRSGLKNPQIGRNLKLHPAALLFGVWPKEIRPWEGGILTALCDEFQNLDGNGHGSKLECLVMLPSWGIPALPGIGLDFKRMAVKFKRMNGFVSMARDKDSGRVYGDSSGSPRIAYTPSATDKAHCMEGIIALAKMCYVMGAEEIHVVSNCEPYIRSEQESSSSVSVPGPTDDNDDEDVGPNHPAFQAWLAKVRAAGLTPPNTIFGSAHQMGSCRMGVSESTSVVNVRGQVWGTKNLYVADASVFPSASGVNPMITNMAISDHISRALARELRRERKS